MNINSPAELYRALCTKDPQYEGVFIACVKTTGVFCRPTCRARKPKFENVDFVNTTQEALRLGYRPCKVCLPMTLVNQPPNWLQALLNEINDDPSIRLRDYDLRQRGLDPNRVRRWFKTHHNITFQSYLRSLRLGIAFGHLTQGGKVIDTAFGCGYNSLSGFTSAFKKLTGKFPVMTINQNLIKTYQILTPLGPMLAASVGSGICLLEFTDRRMLETELMDLQKRFKASIITAESGHIIQLRQELNEYFDGKRQQFTLPLELVGTDFQQNVWKQLLNIPYGETRSYTQQAKSMGNPKSVRAVAAANGANKIAIVIPCHRVIGSDGSLTGYAGGLPRKQHLLELEARNSFKLV